jgi:hypothetical protein
MNDARVVSLPSPDRIIPVFMDVDCTLLRGYMQRPLFAKYGINEREFWGEVQRVTQELRGRDYSVLEETVYLDVLLNFVHERAVDGSAPPLADLSNTVLYEMGAQLETFPGVEDFLRSLRTLPAECADLTGNRSFEQFRIDIYLVSTGFKKTVEGSVLGPLADDIFATEFSESRFVPGAHGQPGRLEETGVLQWPTHIMTHAGKTAAIHQVKKGVHRIEGRGVDDLVPREHWYCDPGNGFAFGDGASDVPMLSQIKAMGGTTIGVYDIEDGAKHAAAASLREQGRFDVLLPADYSIGAPLYNEARLLIARRMEGLLRRRAMTVELETAAAIGHVDGGSKGLAQLYVPPVRSKPSGRDVHDAGRANEPAAPVRDPLAIEFG